MTSRRTTALSLAAILAASPALAHHPLGGETPATLSEGLLSGIGHPMIGLDHLAFIIAAGLAAAMTGRTFTAPLAFIAATVAGALLVVGGIALPVVEPVIALSVVVMGVLLVSGRGLAPAPMLALFAVAGLFHGWAYGEAVIGAEPTPILAYLAAFALTQYAIAISAGLAARAVWQAAEPGALQPRLAGAVIAGIGATFLFENLEALVLPAVG